MKKPEERSGTEASPEERVEDRVEGNDARRAAPIDQNMVGELNAALPEEHPKEGKDGAHG
jgi:hypothetical protein